MYEGEGGGRGEVMPTTYAFPVVFLFGEDEKEEGPNDVVVFLSRYARGGLGNASPVCGYQHLVLYGVA